MPTMHPQNSRARKDLQPRLLRKDKTKAHHPRDRPKKAIAGSGTAYESPKAISRKNLLTRTTKGNNEG